MKDTPHFPCFMNNSSASPSTPKIIGFFSARFSNIFDGIERPLREIAEKSGDFIDAKTIKGALYGVYYSNEEKLYRRIPLMNVHSRPFVLHLLMFLFL